MKEPSMDGVKKEITKIFISHVSEIIDGKEAKDLADSAHYYEMASGDIVIAGTDKGIEYKKDHNEDRLVVSPANNFIAVVDGMGGENAGELAAKILAESLLEMPLDIEGAVENASTKMAEGKVGRGGAVFISAQLETSPEGKILNCAQSGDSRLMIIKKDGTVSSESEDDSMVQTLLGMKKITPDQALYHERRNVISSAVSPYKKDKPKFFQTNVETGDFVLLMSDGISDNLTSEEIAKKIKEGLSAIKLFSWISEETNKRMRDMEKIIGKADGYGEESPEQKAILETRKRDGVYSDGYKSEPKRDNRALAILQVA